MKTAIIIIVVVAVIITGYFLIKKNYSSKLNSAAVETNSVNISNFAFDPTNISVKAGTVVTFTNTDGTNHTITANNGSFDKEIADGQSVEVTISTTGTVSYYCKIHPSMKGTIKTN